MARMRIGILGGTFDPPHIGHLAAAVEARAAAGLDRVLLVVANDPWQKSPTRELSPAGDRLALVRAAVDGVDGLEVCDLEIARGGTTYTIDTLEELRCRFPDAEMFLIVGSDAAAGLHTWHRHEELPSLATLLVVERSGDSPPVVPAGWRVEHLAIPRLDISSTALRARVAAGLPIEPYMPGAAAEMVRARSMYGAQRP